MKAVRIIAFMTIWLMIVTAISMADGPGTFSGAATDPVSLVLELNDTEIDLNGDGKPDLRRMFDESGIVVKRELDRDFDGHADETMRVGRDGEVTIKRDNDHDRFFEETVTSLYDDYRILTETMERDRNKDGKADYRLSKVFDRSAGVVFEIERRDDDFSGRFTDGDLRQAPLGVY